MGADRDGFGSNRNISQNAIGIIITAAGWVVGPPHCVNGSDRVAV